MPIDTSKAKSASVRLNSGLNFGMTDQSIGGNAFVQSPSRYNQTPCDKTSVGTGFSSSAKKFNVANRPVAIIP